MKKDSGVAENAAMSLSTVEMRAGSREVHGSSTSSLLIINKNVYIYIYWSYVQFVRTCSHVIRFIPQVAVPSRSKWEEREY